ncbi:hypothetical protein C9374_000439 [Naegleria lovaniensis]|uniref:Endonuclease V n=1 Tax=Naegleria lovaniensis TaxID=51637 RepID=A0AA88GWI2_NAELO|nr:uncharacterized protein C9374_000439 [Naegleria lovaniensis]KAG2388275.1 hypothetical protein C9374_000439 [Naegleria lovaniensis]
MSSWADLLRGSSSNPSSHSASSSSSNKFTSISAACTTIGSPQQPKLTSVKQTSKTFVSIPAASTSNQNIHPNPNQNNMASSSLVMTSSSLPATTTSVVSLSTLKQQWKMEQLNLKKQLKLYNETSFDPTRLSTTLKYIGGVDISFNSVDPNQAVASLVVLSFPDLKVIYENYHHVTMTVPYIAGFLGFREVPHYVKLLDELKRTQPQIFPQVILVDGNGILHQRGFGSACHLGVIANVPTIGVAKKMLYVDGITEEQVQELDENELERKGDYAYLTGKFGNDLGVMLLTSDVYHEPVYVSIGHCVSLTTAIEIVTMCCIDKIPEPIKQADLRSRKIAKNYDMNKTKFNNRSNTNTKGQDRLHDNGSQYGRQQQPTKKKKH